MILLFGRSVIQTRQHLLVPVDVAHQEVRSCSSCNLRCPITDPFLISLGCHLDDSGDHFFRFWYNHWSPCIQSKSSPDFYFYFGLSNKKLTSFISKVLLNKQAMHHISFLFHEPRLFWVYYLQAVAHLHGSIVKYIYIVSRTFTVGRLGLEL
jgi:hypothetical protein